MPWSRIILGSFLICTFFLGLDLLGKGSRKYTLPMYLSSLMVTILLNTFHVWYTLPALNGPFWGSSWLMYSFFLGCCVAVAYGFLSQSEREILEAHGRKRIVNSYNWAPVLGGSITFLVVGFVMFFMAVSVPMSLIVSPGRPILARFGNEVAAKNLAKMANVQVVEHAEFPETDLEHLNLLPSEVALDKVGRKWSKGGSSFATLMKRGPLVIQEIQGTLNYVDEPRFTGHFAYQQMQGIVPTFFVIDAEDHAAEARPLTGYKIQYLDEIPNKVVLGFGLIPSEYAIKRYLYFRGYSEYTMIDPTMEVDDSLRPYITVGLAKPTYNFTAEQLELFVTIDLQTGEITEYDPEEVSIKAPWIDRVYPDDLYEQYVEWWCAWGRSPHINPSSENVCKIANVPTVVYTDAQHPAWQILVEPKAGKNAGSSMGIFQCNTKRLECKFYEIFGLPVGAPLDDRFEGEASKTHTAAEFDARNIEVHRIEGRLVYIGQWIKPEGEIDGAKEGEFEGIFIAPGKDFQGNEISWGRSFAEALRNYQAYQAGSGRVSEGPVEGAVERKLEGYIYQVIPVPSGERVEYYVYLQGVVDKVFVAPILSGGGLEWVPLSEPGDFVVLTFDETGLKFIYLKEFYNAEAVRRLQNTPVPKTE